MAPVPGSILRALSLPLDPSKSTLSTSGLGSGFTTTGRIRVSVRSSKNGAGEEEEEEEERQYFVKTSASGEEMFRGEHASLNAIASVVPGFCPRSLAWGPFEEKGEPKGFFLVTEYLDLSGRGGGGGGKTTLAQRLGKLHSTPAPALPDGKRGFGFPVATYCGDTRQANRIHDSWADFYANERLRSIVAESEQRNGRDDGLHELVERTATEVVPALLRDGHLGGRAGVTPVVVHGDLWSGNASRGRIVTGDADADAADVSDVVYDPSACYAHSEYDLGIMHMFGGFGRAFFDEYHRVVPQTEPVDEYEDRIRLYEL
jgi:fructosamine-3-kinase